MRIIEENEIVTIETLNGKNILLISPYISRKGFLAFKDTSLDDIKAEYSVDDEFILLNCGNKLFSLNINNSDAKWLNDLYDKKFEIATEYYVRCLNGDIDLIITGNNVDTIELIESSYNPYYIKIFEYTMNKYFNVDNLDIVELSNLILSKVDLNKYELIVDKEWKHYIVPLKDIKK